ncbi:MAG TPA: MFS transporter, partial [Verrucomicrobiae bacterium]
MRPGRSANYKWWVVAMLWFVCFFNYADRQAISGVFPTLRKEFGFDPEQIGLIGSAFMWVYAGGAPFAGFIADRFRRKDLILGGCLFWSLVTMATGWCAKLWQFVTVRALEGFGETFYFPASMSLISDYHSAQSRSRAMSFHQSSVYAGSILGSWLGAWFAETRGWRVGFYFFGGAGVILSIFLFRFLLEPPRGNADAQGAVQREDRVSFGEALALIFRTPTAFLVMGAFMAANFVATIFLMWTPTFLVDKFQFRVTTAGLSGSIFIHLASACAVPVSGWLSDKLALRFAGGRMIPQAVGMFCGAIFILMVGLTQDVTTLLVVMALFGICKGFYDANIFAGLYDVIPPRARGTAAGVMNTVGWGGGALGPLAFGIFTKRGGGTTVENMSEAIAFCSGFYLVAGFLLLIAILFHARRDV